MQPCNRIHYSNVQWRLSIFRAAYSSSSGALNFICSLWFTYTRGDRPLSSLLCQVSFPLRLDNSRSPHVYVNQRLQIQFRVVCCSKHVEPSINTGIINSITRLHLGGYFYWLLPIVWNFLVNVIKCHTNIQYILTFCHCIGPGRGSCLNCLLRRFFRLYRIEVKRIWQLFPLKAAA